MMLVSSGVFSQNTSWRDVHKVKKGETVFGIANEYGITIQELLDANPEMKESGYNMKKGDWIFVPYAKEGDKKVRQDKDTQTTKTSSQNVKPITSISVNSLVKADKMRVKVMRVGVMLPLHNNDGDGKRMVEYYRGMLLAIDKLKSQGINVEVTAWNVPIDADIRTVLLNEGTDKLDVIFGPLYSNMVKPLADFTKRHGIKLVIPFSINENEVAFYDNIYQVYQSPEDLTQKSVMAFLERFPQHHPIFINCNDPTSGKAGFTSSLRSQLEASGKQYSLTNLDTPLESFSKAFTSTQPNVVILNSAKSPLLNRAFEKMDSLLSKRPGVAVSLYGYTEWFMYQKYDLSQFFKYSVYIPTTFYYNASSDKTEALEKLYEESFGEKMMQDALPRFAITGYDQAMFFIRGFCEHGDYFTGSSEQSDYKPLQTRYNFKRIENGGYKNNLFQLVHFLPTQRMEAIVY